jgi:serine/threonine protein kinase
MPLLSKGRDLVSDVTGHCYRVRTHRVAQGGFGEIYKGVLFDRHRDPIKAVAIKVGVDPFAWHGEAYFGRLLLGQENVVPLLDSFPLVDGKGPARQVKYVLVFDWMDGTVEGDLERAGAWPTKRVVAEVAAILKVLALLHRRSIYHCDITPGNVFVHGGRLRLGDLGIARQGLESDVVLTDAAAPPVFVPPDVRAWQWSAADDVYQVGLIALSLLSGAVVTSREACGRYLRSIEASDGMKGWIHDAIQSRGDRFKDAGEALDCLRQPSVVPLRAPRTLRGQTVVFTGRLPIARALAIHRLRKAGGTLQGEVNGQTTVVVSGEANLHMIAKKSGKKLFDAQRRLRRGQRIAIINYEQFERLLAKSRAR